MNSLGVTGTNILRSSGAIFGRTKKITLTKTGSMMMELNTIQTA